jgi:hypothetical protein
MQKRTIRSIQIVEFMDALDVALDFAAEHGFDEDLAPVL